MQALQVCLIARQAGVREDPQEKSYVFNKSCDRSASVSVTTQTERGPYIDESGQLQLAEIADAELLFWSDTKKRPGRPTDKDATNFEERDRFVLRVAQLITSKYPQTIRHIYYVASGLRLVGKDHGDDTHWYNKVAGIIGDARWRGTANSNADPSLILPWDRIIDDTRSLFQPLYHENHEQFIESVSPIFRVDLWKNQPNRVIVCTEKDAIESMLSDVCRKLQVPLISFHGQASDGGVIYPLAKYIHGSWRGDVSTVRCLYLGDYDPSGLNISRAVFGDEFAEPERDDSKEARKRFGKLPYLLTHEFNLGPEELKIEYERIAIVRDDIENPDYEAYILEANGKDNNYDRFLRDTNGDTRTLGIDALNYETLVTRTQAAIEENILDPAEWQRREDYYQAERAALDDRFGSGN
jgi:hypothetical protein